ncbi:ABC transporter ATP-binding protein [Fusobacterium pseudoperiodonticum]|uniref:amino acid ABC transporter ATP-binding/permease protein n=1 Tax=Fusobacterium pseudoperiodonticum TaxID=2663009 RepID=UPI0028E633E0|nr:ABC transporter ATP-binding protein [Fusobacterium pseudoperiodonticum]
MKNRSTFNIVFNLLKLLDSLWKFMTIAVSTGVIGFIFSFCITLFGAYAFLSVIPATKDSLKYVFLGGYSTQTYFYAMMFCGFFRAILHYLEQFANHYIAFHILANIRVKLFKIMRKLAPAKMENKNQGNLISMITSDIELLEVFYAHTISPVLIASITSIFLFLYFFQLNYVYALYMLFAQFIVGIVVPYIAHKRSAKSGVEVRAKLGKLNDEFLDKLKGIREIIQYSQGKKVLKKIDEITSSIGENQKDLRNKASEVQMMVDSAIIILSVVQLLLSISLVSKGLVSIEASILAGVLQVGSFAPYINLAALGNILAQTFASGERVLNLMDEKPAVIDNIALSSEDISETDDISIDNISYAYTNSDNKILKDFSLKIKKGQLTGIMGASGCGKSTLLKLIMRFWDVDSGKIILDRKDVKSLPLKELYQKFNYMTQSTSLFIGNIRDNLLVAKADATDEEIYIALKKASFYDYIISLPDKLDSIVEEGGKNFSGGEKQRIGLARAFLANREFFLLDEPTSNLDILNEAIILKSLADEAKDKTVILVSHRESTLSICNEVFRI